MSQRVSQRVLYLKAWNEVTNLRSADWNCAGVLSRNKNLKAISKQLFLFNLVPLGLLSIHVRQEANSQTSLFFLQASINTLLSFKHLLCFFIHLSFNAHPFRLSKEANNVNSRKEGELFFHFEVFSFWMQHLQALLQFIQLKFPRQFTRTLIHTFLCETEFHFI